MNLLQNTLLKATGAANAPAATGAADAAAAIRSTAASAQQAADRFLTLLVAQLQNQDPLNPLDNSQLTTQLEQISTVSGVNQFNDTVGALGAPIGITQYLEAATLVGHDVVLSGNDLELTSGEGKGGVDLAAAADHVSVTVIDQLGHVVRTVYMGAQKPGAQFFDWDGRTDTGTVAPDGHYTFSVTATASGAAVTFDTLMVATVEGVVSTSSGALIQLAYGNQVAFDAIRQIH